MEEARSSPQPREGMEGNERKEEKGERRDERERENIARERGEKTE